MRVTIRVAAWVLAANVMPAQQHSYTPADVEEGARLYRAHCSACHGLEGDAIAGVELRRGRFRRGTSDEDLTRIITKGIPGTTMPPTNFTPAQMWTMLAYLRGWREAPPGGGAAPGDRLRGQALFEGKAACLTCHRVNGRGSRLAPELSDVGAIRPAGYLERSILEPNESVLPQHRFVRAVTRDGATITGRRLNEDTHTVQLLDSNERLVSLLKADLREYDRPKTSPMPSYKGKLNSQEIADLVQYLVSLKGPDKP